MQGDIQTASNEPADAMNSITLIGRCICGAARNLLIMLFIDALAIKAMLKI